MLGLRYNASRHGADASRSNAIDDDDDLYSGFNDVAPALDTRTLKEDQAFQEAVRTTGIGRQMTSRMGTAVIGLGTGRTRGASRAGTAARPVTALRAAGYTSAARDTPLKEDRKEDSIEDKIKQMELRIMSLVEESCILSAKQEVEDESSTKKEYDLGQALSKAQEASALERQLIRMQEQANMGDSHNLDLTFAVK